MNILFLSLGFYESISISDIYADLLKEFIRHGHRVSIVSPAERRRKIPTGIIRREHYEILYVRTGNIRETNMLEKGISTVLLETAYQAAVRKYFADKEFGLILYVTPPVTFLKAVQYIRRRDNAKTYLMLKDIFPQNAVDLGMLTKTGPKGFLYRKFRRKEKELYAASDRIGCMSKANVEYLLRHNPEISSDKVEECPNSIEIKDMGISPEERLMIRQKYEIPVDRKVFVYGGNLGRPQGIDFLIQCMKTQEKNQDAFFLIVGSGTEYKKVKSYLMCDQPENVKLIRQLPKKDYDRIVGSCDVGMIFLDYRFTIPNFPSRLLSYMQARLPVLAVTDVNTDIGEVIVDGGFGWWCESRSTLTFDRRIREICLANDHEMKRKAVKSWNYLCKQYDVRKAAGLIMEFAKSQ